MFGRLQLCDGFGEYPVVKSPDGVGDVAHGNFQGTVGRVVPNAHATHFLPEAFDKPFNRCARDDYGLTITFDLLQELDERNHGVDRGPRPHFAIGVILRLEPGNEESMSAVEVTPQLTSRHAGPQAELARKCLYYMQLMREAEDPIERKLHRQGKILGGVYVGRGQEAIPVGSALLAEPGDVLFPSHRDMAVFFIRGVSARRVLAQYMGRMGGVTRGRDGNMHMGDMSVGVGSIISALAATVPVAAGAA